MGFLLLFKEIQSNNDMEPNIVVYKFNIKIESQMISTRSVEAIEFGSC
jgi:hypothetical protein